MTDERKIREIYGVKSVHEEAAERTEATWREKLLRETADLRTENALLRARLDEFNRKLVEATDRNEKIERLRGERDAALKTQADTLLAQRDLMAEVAALKDRLAASEQRAAVAEAKVEVMSQMKGE